MRALSADDKSVHRSEPAKGKGKSVAVPRVVSVDTPPDNTIARTIAGDELFLVVEGDMTGGFLFHGPFLTETLAEAYGNVATTHVGLPCFEVVAVEPVDHERAKEAAKQLKSLKNK